MIKIIDEALSGEAYKALLLQIACGPFADEVNPVDYVVYPMICKKIPPIVTEEISKICKSIGDGEFIEFLRASPEGVSCPHPVHHDAVMGRFSLMLYTSDMGGTGILAHKRTGAAMVPDDPEIESDIAEDTANHDAWEPVDFVKAKPNRLAIFDSRLYHSAIPYGGFGDGVNARTVYTRFFK